MKALRSKLAGELLGHAEGRSAVRSFLEGKPPTPVRTSQGAVVPVAVPKPDTQPYESPAAISSADSR